MIDAYYTPKHLAEFMISNASVKSPKIICDFAVGDGVLLNCAQEKWPESKIIATDISKKAIQVVKRNYSSWLTGRCDFLNSLSYKRCSVLKKVMRKCSLILLNPPFSCRAWESYIVMLGDIECKCSKAIAFLINSLEYLSSRGELIAILPAGAIDASKDEKAWEYIHSNYCVEVIGTNGHNTFKGCSPKTTIVKIKRGTDKHIANKRSQDNLIGVKKIKKVEIYRGRISVDKMNIAGRKRSFLFVHTTNLHNKKIQGTFNKVYAKDYETIKGPAVLLPRVGKTEKSKISLYLDKDCIALSDCVMALVCDSNNHAQMVYKRLSNNWNIFKKHYGGTCAPYITIEKLKNALMILNVET
jgi:Fe-S-cluster containining protein